MKALMRKCVACRLYTLGERCPRCRGILVPAHPAKFSPDDRYAEYRRPEAYSEGH
ncbi:MAG: RNA-protein complex protein Nop10 [Thermoprotei archaeon]